MALTHSYQLQQYGGQPVRVEHPLPPLQNDEILIRVTHAGVCHSDVYIQDGYQDLGNGEKIDFADSTMPMPLVMGHEIVGEVVATGNEQHRSLIGQRRLIYPWIGCGNCPSCTGGHDNHCEQPRSLGIFRHGGYAEHVVVPDARYLLDIGDLDPAWACTLACSGLTVYSALQQLLPMKSGSALAIVGLGGLGLSAVSLARKLGFSTIIACDIADDRLEAALKLGADRVLNTANSEDAEQALKSLAGQRLHGVIDTVGSPATVQMAIGAVAKGSRVVLVGLHGGQTALRIPLLPFKALSLIGSYTGSLSELQALIALVRQGGIAPLPINQRPLCCLPDALSDLRRGKALGRIVLNP
ncbi:alcohol dehydrogenase [Pantoea coffeiphila]|uniref:alcohol dehydrogenase n=1 Tax=Pantoea coffeiphila TaxID=1465635 RepID=UPI00195FF6FB|nr:alcohol dehydrogenase [Pantoea coffeiphila]MBM7342073.1 D-arabinose 1-dehydrogenase-like Zn-dependent alcohol dehydrogenase [Pantoea coffeiphila]